MIYDVKHVTIYKYESPAAAAQFSLRLTPRQGRGQRVEAAAIEIEPKPSAFTQRDDFFGNRVTKARVDAPHRELRIVATSRVTLDRHPPTPQATPAWETIAALAASSPTLSPDAPAHGLFPSRLAPLRDEISAWAVLSFPPGRSALEGAMDLMKRVQSSFRYDPRATAITTPIAEAFAKRAGVCQDFAHIMIAGLRGLGLPAIYVSGYVRTIPPPGRPRLEGADASHAWVRVWCGAEAGWIGLDPTNALIVARDHVTLAYGRDYSDVSPVDGVFIGSGKHALTVKVDMKPVG